MFKLNNSRNNKNNCNSDDDNTYDYTNPHKQHYKMKGIKLIIDNKIKSIIIVILLVLFNLLNVCSANVVGIDEPKLNFDNPVTTIIAAKSDLSPIGDGILHNNDNVNSISSNNIDDNNDIELKNTQNDDNSKSSSKLSNLGFIHAFIASISVIIVSELGDKTFFIAAIMAMRHPRLTVFTGAISALALMTILSVVFGMAATIIPRVYTYYISTALFAIFGIKMLKEGYTMSAKDTQEEFKKCEDEVLKKPKNKQKSDQHENSDSKDDHSNDDDDDDGNVITNLMENNNHRNMNNDDIIRNCLNRDDTNVHNDNIDEHDRSYNDDIINKNKKTGKHMRTVFKTSHSTSSISSNSDDGSSLRATATKLNHHGNTIVIVHNNNNNSTVNSSTQSKLRITNNNNNNNTSSINTNGIELMQLNNKGGCKNRLEKGVSVALVQDAESGLRKSNRSSAAYLASRIFMQAFTMTFLAEWGDRSQLTTIILSAREDVYGVIVGGVLGHSLCTGLAVVGGRIIAQKISVRTVTLVGGVVFLLFAISALFFNPNEEQP